MTEKEAQRKQCCVGGCGYLHPDSNVRYCVASNCMGWRTNEKPDRIEQGIAVYSGYCGRAGKP